MATKPRAFFLEGSAGRLFALHVPAAQGTAASDSVLMFPAFAEEMNKSRRQAMLQAQAFAASGRDVLLVDLYGTGESEGDFSQARWHIWLDDMERAARWLMENGSRGLCFSGLRLGAQLAFSLASGAFASKVTRLLLWQPVAIGKSYLTQFLRLRLAAQMSAGGGEDTTASLREQLAAGQAIEVAGYTLAPELATAIDALNLKAQARPVACPVDWVEVAAEGRGLTPASRAVAEALRSAGNCVSTHLVVGEAFWNTPETTTVAALTNASVAIVEARAA